MMRAVRETMTAENPHDLVYRDGQVPFPTVWTVELVSREQWGDYAVRATEKHTGAVVPAREPHVAKQLHRARRLAAELFAVVTSASAIGAWVPDAAS